MDRHTLIPGFCSEFDCLILTKLFRLDQIQQLFVELVEE